MEQANEELEVVKVDDEDIMTNHVPEVHEEEKPARIIIDTDGGADHEKITLTDTETTITTKKVSTTVLSQ